VYTEELREFLIPHPFIHLSTFGGSDLACAIALATIEVIEEEQLVENAARMGLRLHAGLVELAAEHKEVVAETRGRGLMVGLKFKEDSYGPRMSYQLSERGVLAIYSGNESSVMRLMPSLVVGADEVDFLITALSAAMKAVESGSGPADAEQIRARRRPSRI
jgi:acetylornithine/succinyldiaminopimelate/putrescine aminotransferase